MIWLTRRQFLCRALLGTLTLTITPLIVACGQPESESVDVGAAIAVQATTTRTVTGAGTPGTPGGPLPTPTLMPTAEGTVTLPTVVSGPNPGPQLKPTPDAPPLPYTTPRPQDPLRITVMPARTANPKSATQRSTLVVVGTIVQVQPARWTTADGRRPSNPHDPAGQGTIFTPVRVEVESFAKGAQSPRQLLVFATGGEVGQDSITRSDNLFAFGAVGERVVLFLSPRIREPLALDGTPLWYLEDRYTVIPEELATNAYQTLPLQQLLDIVAVSAATPLPVPQSTRQP